MYSIKAVNFIFVTRGEFAITIIINE